MLSWIMGIRMIEKIRIEEVRTGEANISKNIRRA